MMIDTIVLGVGALVVVSVLVRWHLDPDNTFKLSDLIADETTGKISLFRTGQAIALLVSTWGFVVLTRSGKLSEWYFAGYMLAWAGANLAKVALTQKANESPKGQP
jgi:hypothetical protein